MTFFLACAVFGGILIVAQLVLGFADGHVGHVGHVGGVADAHDLAHHGPAVPKDGLHLLSVRSLAAGVAFFGVAGGAIRAAGGALPLAVAGGLVAGLAAAVGVAAVVRAMTRLSTDTAVRIEGAVGLTGSVYIPIPAAKAGAGKVQLCLQGRTVEYEAVSGEATPLRTGDRVLVIDVITPDTLVVARASDPLVFT